MELPPVRMTQNTSASVKSHRMKFQTIHMLVNTFSTLTLKCRDRVESYAGISGIFSYFGYIGL